MCITEEKIRQEDRLDQLVSAGLYYWLLCAGTFGTGMQLEWQGWM